MLESLIKNAGFNEGTILYFLIRSVHKHTPLGVEPTGAHNLPAGKVVVINVAYQCLGCFGYFQVMKQLIGNAFACSPAGKAFAGLDTVKDILPGFFF